MAKKRKSEGLWAFAKIERSMQNGHHFAALTLYMGADELAQFLRVVAPNNMSSIPPGQLPDLRKNRILRLLPRRPDGRPAKNTHPLWDAYQRAKTEDPDLSKRRFVVR